MRSRSPPRASFRCRPPRTDATASTPTRSRASARRSWRLSRPSTPRPRRRRAGRATSSGSGTTWSRAGASARRARAAPAAVGACRRASSPGHTGRRSHRARVQLGARVVASRAGRLPGRLRLSARRRHPRDRRAVRPRAVRARGERGGRARPAGRARDLALVDPRPAPDSVAARATRRRSRGGACGGRRLRRGVACQPLPGALARATRPSGRRARHHGPTARGARRCRCLSWRPCHWRPRSSTSPRTLDWGSSLPLQLAALMAAAASGAPGVGGRFPSRRSPPWPRRRSRP